jgi:hypothetical protein
MDVLHITVIGFSFRMSGGADGVLRQSFAAARVGCSLRRKSVFLAALEDRLTQGLLLRRCVHPDVVVATAQATLSSARALSPLSLGCFVHAMHYGGKLELQMCISAGR